MDKDRERIIRAAWEERGKAQWNPETHGRGLLSLHIPAEVEMRPVRFGEPKPPYDDLEFWLVRATMNGQPVNSIVCEGVVVETLNGASQPTSSAPSPPSLSNVLEPQSWDAAAEIAASRRGRSAAILSGETGPTAVRSDPPETLQAQSSALEEKSEPLFSNRRELQRWLSNKPQEWAVAIAARSALRAVPALADTFTLDSPDPKIDQLERTLVLPVFRASAAAWLASAYPAASPHYGVAERAAAEAAKARNDSARAAAAAAYAVAANAAERASHATDYAAQCAPSVKEAIYIWGAAVFDARILERGISPESLALYPLWPTKQVPPWLDTMLEGLWRALMNLNSDWEGWFGWYLDRLNGGPTNQQLEVSRVVIADEFWQEGPRVVNARLNELIGTHGTWASDVPALPTPGPGPRFQLGENGTIERAPPSLLDESGNDLRTINQLKPMVQRCLSELRSHIPRNEFPELLRTVDQYYEALNTSSALGVEWGEVWGLGVLLQNAASAAQRLVAQRLLPELEDPAKTALDSLLALHGPLILASGDGAKLAAAAQVFAMTRDQQADLRAASEHLAAQLEEHPNIITPLAAASIAKAVDTIGEGSHPERGSVYALATIKNVSIILIGGAAAATPALIGALLGSAALGAVIGAPITLVAVETVKKNPAFNALVTQLGAKLDTMSDMELRGWIEERGRRLAPFRSFVISNEQHLRMIAEATSELKWMLRYIDFVVGKKHL